MYMETRMWSDVVGVTVLFSVLIHHSRSTLATECGVRASDASDEVGDKRITGGHESTPGGWPWMAAVLVDGPPIKYFKCGATLISDRWVITAGHCGLITNEVGMIAAAHKMPSRLKIRLGEHNLKNHDGNEQEIRAKRVIFNPKWDIVKKNTKGGPKTISTNDMMLIELEKPVNITKHVYPVCLKKDNFKPDQMCQVAGWGSSKVGGPLPNTLHEAAVPIVSQQDCNKPESYSGVISTDMICAGYQKGGKDTCQGDSGGPLMCQGDDKKWYIAGIASFGHKECGEPNKYGIYASVPAAREWITKYTGGGIKFM